MLDEGDLPLIQRLASERLSTSSDSYDIFSIGGGEQTFKFFVLPAGVDGSNEARAFGYFNSTGELIGVIGSRQLTGSPSWVLSFILTDWKNRSALTIIKELMQFVIKYREQQGLFQWFVVSRLDKFKAWQRLFSSARGNYHHYVYARVPANTCPKWFTTLQYSGGKLFPYDINVSMYVSKTLLTNDTDSFEFHDCAFI